MITTIDGLPLHPLLVHAAVVLLAVNGGALIACVALPRFRRWLGWGLPLLGVATAATTWLTKRAGEDLLGERSTVTDALAEHTHWGGWAGVIAVVLGVTTLAYWSMHLGPAVAKAPWLAHRVTRVGVSTVSVLVAITAIVLDILAGHSGATSVWGLG
ncbi:MAG: hypothetical protein WA962_02435 [Ornithinimicrobium sp.]